MKNIIKLLCISLLTFTIVSCNTSSNNASKKEVELTISAASSLKESMSDIKTEFEKENPNITLTFNFASSGSLQKQIEQGAPSDIFISAADSNMDTLENEDLIIKDSRKTLVTNSLVLIVPSELTLTNITNLTNSNFKHIAMGDPSSVPAGKYAEEVLNSTNLKAILQEKLVYAKDVKEVLSWVSTGNAEAGFVYKTDALTTNTVTIADNNIDNYHSAINYPVAIIKDSKNISEAEKFENFLFSDYSKEIFIKYGYSTVA